LSKNRPVGLRQVIEGQDNIHLQAVPFDSLKVIIVEYAAPGTRPYLKSPFDDEDLQTGQITVWPKTLTKNAYS